MSSISTHCEIPFSGVKYAAGPGWQNNSTWDAITTITTTLAAVNTSRTNCSSSSIKLPRRRNSPNWPPRTIPVKYLPLRYTSPANVADEILSRSILPSGDLKQYETMEEKTSRERDFSVECHWNQTLSYSVLKYVSGLIVLEKRA